MPTISGVVTGDNSLGAPGRVVRAYRRDTGVLLAETVTSDLVAGDDNFASVGLLLHMEGTPGGTVFTDSSQNAIAMTPGGNANTSSGAAKFGTTAAYFDGVGDFIGAASNSAISLGTGDFTVECFIKPNSVSSGVPMCIFDMRPNSSTETGIAVWQSDATLWLKHNSFNFIEAPGVLIAGWQHIAVCRVGTTFKLYVGGVQAGPSWTATKNWTSTVVRLGADVTTPVYPYAGYIDDFRITKGLARYTAAFTPPAAAFPDVPGSVAGQYSIATAHTGEVNVVCLDDAPGTNYNDLILRTTPV